MADSVVAAPPAEWTRSFAFLLAPAAVLGLLLAEALVLPTAWLPLDEAAAVERARGLPGALTGPLYPLLLAPVARHAGAHALLVFGHVIGAVCWTGVGVVTYFLARRTVSARVAAAAALLAVLVPGAAYSAALTPEALATLLGGGALAVAAVASERSSARLLGAALACATAAAFARPWLAALPPAIAAAYALPRLRGRAASPLRIAVGVAALYGLFYGLGAASPELAVATGRPWTVLRDGLGSLGAAAVGFGIVPALTAGARLGLRPAGILLSCAAPALAFAAGLSAAGTGGGVDERPLLVLTPLVFALAAEVWSHGLRPRRLAAASAGVAVALAAVPWPAAKPTLAHAPGLEFARGLLGGGGAAPAVLSVAALAAAAVLSRGHSRAAVWTLAGVVLVLVPGGELVAWNQARRAADSLAAALPHPHDWVDRAVGTQRGVDLVTATGAVPPEALAELRIWNRALRAPLLVDPAAADARTGMLNASPAHALALAIGVDLAGETVARSPQGSVLRVTPPLRVAERVEGLYPDGWSGADVAYRRFAGRAGTLRVTISRKAWGGPDTPGAVSVISSPIGGSFTARRDAVVHAGREVVVDVPVPAAPFEVDVHLDTFSPASFGQSDTRRLGAQLGFEYHGRGVG